ETPSYQDLSVHARADAAQVTQWLPKGQWSQVTASGMIGIAGVLSGPLQTPRLKGAAELKDTQLSWPGIVTKAATTPASIEFEGGLLKDNVLQVERLDLVISPFRLAGKGRIRLQPTLAFDGTIVSGPISLAGLPTDFSLGPAKDGILEVSLEIKGKGDDWRTWNIGGWVALTDALIVPKGAEDPITDLYLRLKLIRGGAEIKRLAFKTRDSDLRISGSIRNWQRVPIIALTVESSQLDLNVLIPKGRRSPMRDTVELLAATSRVMANISVDRAYYHRFLFTDLSWRLQIRDGMLLADHISGDTDDGHLDGRLTIQVPLQQAATLETSIRASGIPFQHVTALFGTEEQLIRGRLSFDGTLRGHEAEGGILKTVQSSGPLDVLIEDGRILKFSAISKIITILNLPTLLQGKVDLSRDGMPFDRISGAFRVDGGVVTIDKLLVDSPVMKMSGAGRYDMVTDRVDAVMATSPFGSYSQLLKSIPLFGKLLKGDRPSVDTALFEVKGPLKDPQVSYMPIKSFAKGLSGLAQLAFDVLINTVTLPAEILTPGGGEARKPPPPSESQGTEPEPPPPVAATP
ncbi:MAG TPA: AsmA-like C-terminal domain-containing protein, partial [Nitrospirales bacterium]|nr:AsmA-like C-terminal domain-containing protein [Nitrospirales bacterium]